MSIEYLEETPNFLKEEKPSDKDIFITNIKYIILYALIFSIAFGINQTSMSVFASFPNSQHFVSRIIYLVILIGLTIFLAWLMKSKLNSIN